MEVTKKFDNIFVANYNDMKVIKKFDDIFIITLKVQCKTNLFTI